MGVLVGVADKDKATVEEVAKIHDTTAFNDFENMLDETKPDGVVIATPTSTHATIAQTIATNYEGIKGILIEKPLASSLEDGAKVAEVVKKRGIVTLISHSEIYWVMSSKTLGSMTLILWQESVMDQQNSMLRVTPQVVFTTVELSW
jgi:predicted dehydrogenase